MGPPPPPTWGDRLFALVFVISFFGIFLLLGLAL